MSAASFASACYRIAPRRIALLRFLAEGYDGLLFIRTLDPRLGLVEISWPTLQSPTALALIAALGEELGLAEEPCA